MRYLAPDLTVRVDGQEVLHSVLLLDEMGSDAAATRQENATAPAPTGATAPADSAGSGEGVAGDGVDGDVLGGSYASGDVDGGSGGAGGDEAEVGERGGDAKTPWYFPRAARSATIKPAVDARGGAHLKASVLDERGMAYVGFAAASAADGFEQYEILSWSFRRMMVMPDGP